MNNVAISFGWCLILGQDRVGWGVIMMYWYWLIMVDADDNVVVCLLFTWNRFCFAASLPIPGVNAPPQGRGTVGREHHLGRFYNSTSGNSVTFFNYWVLGNIVVESELFSKILPCGTYHLSQWKDEEKYLPVQCFKTLDWWTESREQSMLGTRYNNKYRHFI